MTKLSKPGYFKGGKVLARQEIDIKNQDQKQSIRIKDSSNITIHQVEGQFLKIVQVLQSINNWNLDQNKSIKKFLW